MAYSQQTTHYGLPLPTSGDKSTFLDTNDAFGRIDSDIYEAKTNATAAVQDIGQIQLDVSQLKASTLEMQTDISQLASRQTISETNITALQSAMATARADVSKLQNDYGTTNISEIGDGTVTGAISALASDDHVEVVAETNDTMSELFNKLYALIDNSKITDKSYLIWSDAYKAELSFKDNSYLIYSNNNVTTTALFNRSITLKTTGSSMTQAAITSAATVIKEYTSQNAINNGFSKIVLHY